MWSGAAWLCLLVNAALYVVAGISLWYWKHATLGDPERTAAWLKGYPYTDFTLFTQLFAHWRTRDFYATHYSYPPAAGLMLAFFFRLFRDPAATFYKTMIAVPMVAGVWFSSALTLRGMRPVRAGLLVCAMLGLSYPWLFEWQRANLEAVLFALVALGVAAYWRGWYWAAAVCFGVLTAAKLYPVTLLGLLWAKRRYWETVAACAVAAGMHLLGLWVLGPTMGEASHLIAGGMSFLRAHVTLAYFYLGFDHSLFALLKGLVYQPEMGADARLGPWLTAYVGAVAVGGLLLYFVRIVRLPRTNQVAALVIVSVLVPPMSYEYTLIHLYVVWAVLLLAVQRAVAVTGRAVLWMFALLGVLLSPVTILFYMGVRIGGEVKCVVLVALLVLVLRYPIGEAEVPATEALV